MWAISKQKVENFFDRMTRSMNLDTKKILSWYSYVLFIAPLLFWALIALRGGASNQSIKMMIMKQPAVAIAAIAAIVDFVLGYYLMLNKKQFLKMKENKDFVTTTKYRENLYGITRQAVEKIIRQNVVPILIVAPDSFQQMEEIDKYLVVFVDADNAELEERYDARNHTSQTSDALAQIEADRKYADYAHYLLKNHKIEKTIELIEMLWQSVGSGGGLPQKMISLMLECDMLLKNASIEKVQGASYDLTLGDEYYYGGRIKRLSDENLILKIEPYDYAIVSCKEYVTLPKDITANFGLTVGLFCQGIILSNGQQVDPGFRGTLFCLLFNTSNKAVIIKRNSHYATIEFNKMLDFAPQYKGKNQDKVDILDYIPSNVMQGAINELKQEIEALKQESKNMQNLYMGVISIIFAAISILLILN